jgi:hypothetical protein
MWYNISKIGEEIQTYIMNLPNGCLIKTICEEGTNLVFVNGIYYDYENRHFKKYL